MPKSTSCIAWVRAGDRRAAVVYCKDELDFLLTDYSIYLSDIELLRGKTVESEILKVKAFLDYLESKRMSLSRACDRTLRDFRDSEVSRVRRSLNASRSAKCAQRTVNAKLRRIYSFLLWTQSVEGMFDSIIGPSGCAVTSTLPTSAMAGKRTGGGTNRRRDDSLYPLLFRGAGERTRHGTQYEATADDVALLTDYFFSICSPYSAQRNVLIMDLACQMSWRRGSINSLTCDQFSGLALDDPDREELVVVPPSQKFGYERAFEVPFRLAFRVAQFIAESRRELLTSNGWTEARTEGRVFVSERDGRPLRDGSISSLFGRAFKTLGRPRGANVHSFRRKFANDQIEKEILMRLELGLDTSAVSVATSVALSMGQSGPESLIPYVSSRLGRMALRRTNTRDERLQHLVSENAALKARLAALDRDRGSS